MTREDIQARWMRFTAKRALTVSRRSLLAAQAWRRACLPFVLVCSASPVVNPAPVKAERAWNWAASRERPVRVRATVATRSTISERVTTRRNEINATMVTAPHCARFMPTQWRGPDEDEGEL